MDGDGANLTSEAKEFISFAQANEASSVVFHLDHVELNLDRSTSLGEAFNDYQTVHDRSL